MPNAPCGRDWNWSRRSPHSRRGRIPSYSVGSVSPLGWSSSATSLEEVKPRSAVSLARPPTSLRACKRSPGEVVIAQTTRREVGNLFDFRDLGTVDVKGIAAPVQAWQALRSSAAESRFEALHLTALTPLVGREEEIKLLLRRWGRAKAGDGQVVLLSGEPVIGKSRLAIAVEEKLQNEPHTRMRYFCSQHQSENALHPIISHLRRSTGLERGDTTETSLKKLEAL